MMRTICITLLAVLLGVGLAAGADKSAGQPNVLLIYTDDHAQWAVGAYGNKEVHTPNIDRLAAEGMRFTRGFTKPVCSPSRAMVVTGQYSHRLGIPDYIPYGNPVHAGNGLPAGTPTVASVLKRAGYATGRSASGISATASGIIPRTSGSTRPRDIATSRRAYDTNVGDRSPT